LDISRRKDEILRLIGQLKASRSSEIYAQASPLAPAERFERPRRDALARPRLEPLDPRPRREAIRQDPVGEDLSRRLAVIEERLAKVEQILDKATNGSRSIAARPRTNFPRSLASRMPSGKSADGREALGPAVSIQHTLGGIVREGVLADIIQYLHSAQMTGVLTLECESGGPAIHVYLRDGEVYSARCGKAQGQDAFFSALAVSKGAFAFDETSDLPAERTIDANTQMLILEGLRQVDEGTVADPGAQQGGGK